MNLSKVGWKLRRDRRESARKEGVPFEPKYNGEGPKSYEELYGNKRKLSTNKFDKIGGYSVE